MQILESTVIGLRSARITLSSPHSSVEVTLFPMVHIGERAFYEAVYADALDHDVVLAEGVDSPTAKRLVREYERVARSAKLGLVCQSAVRPGRGRARVVRADLAGEEFAEVWRRVPVWQRLAFGALTPLAFLHFRFSLSREALAKALAMEDRRSPEELNGWRRPDALEHAIMGARDQRLVEQLEQLIAGSNGEPLRVAIVFGAGHMRAVLRHLVVRWSYRASHTEWRVVFSL
jgi:hypothetical protein